MLLMLLRLLSDFCVWLFRQDMMSWQLLFSLVSQSVTLIHRGQTFFQFPYNFSIYRNYYCSVLLCFVIHSFILFFRALIRPGGFERYLESDFYLWIVMFVSPLLQIVVGIKVNTSDDQSYKRYLQFLRLEFDTRLGMYSPR